jgi:ABC-2 type transport system permease protein
MNRGLLAKALRESWAATFFLAVGLALTEAMLAFALLKFQDQFSVLWSQLPFAQIMLRALLGADVSGGIGPEIFASIAWAHPVVLALLWAHAIIYCTRVPTGEVDRGTIDVLLGLPVSRWQLYRTESFLWLVSGVAVLLMGVAGNVLGNSLVTGRLRDDPFRLAIVIANLFCLYLAVGGLAWLVSALSSRRGRAMGVALAFVLGWFLLNYLAQLWSVADRLSFLSVLHYYRPLPILRDGTWPVRDMIVLLVSGAALWTAGGFVFARRDLSTL